LVLVLAVALSASTADGQQLARDTPRQLLDSWVELWETYDLDTVPALFLQNDALTYFSSETEGLIEGFDRIVEHHRGFGFVSGGEARDQLIWVRNVRIEEFGDTAFIGAIWYFGDPDSPADAQRGPMSVLAVRTADGYRIAHMHFATYAE
jgi:ketosteroid isomerase-like protein